MRGIDSYRFTLNRYSPGCSSLSAREAPVGYRYTFTKVSLLSIFLVAFLIVILCRIWFIARYGSSVPYWDQWTAEADLLYKPIVAGDFHWSTLWQLHNEHRIFFTRVLAIALFLANQMQWDPMVQVFADSIIAALACAAAITWSIKHLDGPGSVIVGIGLVFATIVPNGWENSLGGFQSCFYFVIIFSVSAIGVAAMARVRATSVLLISGLCLAAQLSLASGSLAALAVLVVIVARVWTAQLSTHAALEMAIPVFLIFVCGVITTPSVFYHEVYRAANPSEFFQSLIIALQWPVPNFLGLLLWLPFALFALQTLRRGRAAPADLAVAGIALWVLLVSAAIAYGRGHGMIDMWSRYTDIAVFGVLSNGYFFAQQLAHLLPVRRWQYDVFLGLVILLPIVGMLELQWLDRYPLVIQRAGTTRIAASNVYSYLDGNESAFSDKLPGYVPVAAVLVGELERLLSYSDVDAFLPFSLIPIANPAASAKPRLCSWAPASDSSSETAPGTIVCGKENGVVNRSSSPSVSVGPLSALSYRLWALARSQWMVPLLPSDSKPDAPTSDTSAPIHCALDNVNDQSNPQSRFNLSYPGAIKVQGWAWPREEEGPVQFSFVSADGKVLTASSVSSVFRSDVADFFHDQSLVRSGFEMWIDGSSLSAGSYRIEVSVNGSAPCDTKALITISDAADRRLAY